MFKLILINEQQNHSLPSLEHNMWWPREVLWDWDWDREDFISDISAIEQENIYIFVRLKGYIIFKVIHNWLEI